MKLNESVNRLMAVDIDDYFCVKRRSLDIRERKRSVGNIYLDQDSFEGRRGNLLFCYFEVLLLIFSDWFILNACFTN